jgi:hypothetical protein
MNEFNRRMLALAQQHADLRSLVAAMGSTATIEHFGYSLRLGSEASPLTDGTLFSDVIPMQADSWFALQYVSSCVIRPETPYWCSDSGNVQLEMTDTGAGFTFYSTPSSAGVLTATISRPQPGIPFLLPILRLIPPSTNVKVDARQMGVNVTDNQEPIAFFVSLQGSRIGAA